MGKVKYVKTPLDKKTIASLRAGDEVLLSGQVYTARDQVHLKLRDMIKNRKALPVDLKGIVIYYCGPTPPCKRAIGSCGPTTSGRMDPFTPDLLRAGMKGMIGKGRRSARVRDQIKRSRAVYFIAPGGAGAYLSEKVKACEVVAFRDLGPEALYRLTVKDFPLIVGIDSRGLDIYEGLQG